MEKEKEIHEYLDTLHQMIRPVKIVKTCEIKTTKNLNPNKVLEENTFDFLSGASSLSR